MTLLRIIDPAKGFGDKLSSVEIGAIDQNIEGALDKRAGQTDECSSDVVFDGELTFTNTEIHSGTETHSGPVGLSGTVTATGTVDVTGGVVEFGASSIPTTDVTLGSGSFAFSPARSVTRLVPFAGACVGQLVTQVNATPAYPSDPVKPLVSSDFSVSMSTAQFISVVTGTNFGNALMIDIGAHVPDGATLTSVVVNVQGAAHGSMPAKMPRISVGTSGGLSMHSSGVVVIDSSAGTGAYATAHDITATIDQNNVINKATTIYSLMIANEAGTNAVINLLVRSITITFTVPGISPAPC